MAVFEQARLRELAGAARGWNAGRFTPLYLAGLLAGAGIGVGMTYLFDEPAGFDSRPVVTIQAPVPATGATLPVVVEMPIVVPTWTWPEGDPGALPPEMPATLAVEPPAALPVAEAVVEATLQPAAPAPVVETRAIEQPAPLAAPERPNFYIPAVAGANAALEQEMVTAVNTRRAEAGLPPYAYDAGLTNIARMRSQQMIDQGYFGHVDPYGYSMYWELLKHFGYSYAWAGENLAMNNYAIGETVERATNALMNSPTHRDNILANDFFRIGIGEVTAADGRHFFTMIFLG